MRKSIIFRLFFSVGFVVLFVVILSGWIEVRNQTEFMQGLFYSRAEQLAAAFEANLSLEDKDDLEGLQNKVQKFALSSPELIELTMKLDENGVGMVVASTNLQKIGKAEIESRKEVEHEHDIFIRNIDLLSKEDVEIIYPWHIVGKHIGNYKLTLSADLIRKEFLDQVRISLLFVMFTGVLLGGLFLVLVKTLLVDKLRSVSDGVSHYGSDNFEYRLDIKSDDEIGVLALAFNNMADKLQGYWEGLESQVDEKTRELNQKMKELQSKTYDQEDTQKAMINLLEDAKELEEDLKTEKEGVENKVLERTSELQKQTKALEEARQRATAGWVQLQAEKARLNASMEALPLGLVILDTNHQVVACNNEIRKIASGMSEGECDPENFADFLKELGLSIKETCPHCNNSKVFNKDAIPYGDRFIRVIAVPVKNEKETIGSTYLFEDITEGKRLQKTRDEFFSVASHELRTPLTAIRGNTQMLQDYYPEIKNNSEIKEMVEDIHSASLRLIGIVNDFLDASRLELKKVDMKLEAFSIKKLIEKVMGDVKPETYSKTLEYQLKADENDEFLVSADVNRLEQVIINILGNALKFTKKGGVYVSLERTSHEAIKVKITDTGVGISEDDQVELFVKFKQVGSNAGLARDVSQGTGMGLYISKLIMQAMGGRIYLESSIPGKGATFVFEVPESKQT